MIDPRRLARAIWLKIQPVSDGYLVSGGADDHIVEIDGGYVRCDCIDAQRNGHGCKHSLAVRLHGGDPEVVKALRALLPPPAGRSTQRLRVRHGVQIPESPNSGGTGPDSRQTTPKVGPGTTITADRKGQPR